MEQQITTSREGLTKAFTEWERRYRENPEKFQSDQQHAAESPETHGEACAPYFIEILKSAKESF